MSEKNNDSTSVFSDEIMDKVFAKFREDEKLSSLIMDAEKKLETAHYAEAEAVIDQIPVDQWTRDIHLIKARARFLQFDPVEAFRWFSRGEAKKQQLISLRYSPFIYKLRWAVAHIDNNEPARALDILNSLLSENPRNHNILCTLVAASNFPESERECRIFFQKAKETRPGCPHHFSSFAELEIKLGHISEASALVEHSLSIEVGWHPLFMKGIIALKAGKKNEAEKLLLKAKENLTADDAWDERRINEYLNVISGISKLPGYPIPFSDPFGIVENSG